MPDQYGRITGRDWLGLAGAISNIDTMRRGREYLGMRRAEEKRKATLFEQGQRDRAKKQKEEDVYNNVFSATIQDYVNAGIADPQQKTFTQKGLEMLVDTPGDRNQVMAILEQYGEYAPVAARAVTEANKSLLNNEQTLEALTKILLDRSDRNYKVVSDLIKGGETSLKKGDMAGAARDFADALEKSGYRMHARPTKDNKVEVWKVVMGKRQPSQFYTLQEALVEAKKLSREKFVSQTAAEKRAGIESNFNPKIITVVDPQGNTYHYRQHFKLDGSVEYLVFGPDHKPAPNAPPTPEQAYDMGWMPKDEKAEADLALTKAKTEKIRAEKEKIEKPKAEKPMTADEARKRLADLAKFEASLNKTGGWNETVFELMAKKDPEFAKSALTINSSKKKVRETIKKLREYYESLIPEFTPKSFGPSDAPEGTTATNPDTGEKVITKNGEWILLE